MNGLGKAALYVHMFRSAISVQERPYPELNESTKYSLLYSQTQLKVYIIYIFFSMGNRFQSQNSRPPNNRQHHKKKTVQRSPKLTEYTIVTRTG